ncbi:Hypothetical protein PHPALM_9780 [Phytophthora palmivora]|uniref:Uncharacterized protein n=1 Tax=Phytophthora palmivora TaxID=4796 RepID=A0A2P4Y6E3_9STRA|nr:Hypothetical protein PHPALM_9780 [Phytophthora palmivora]
MLRYKVIEVAADEDLSRDVVKASHSGRRRFMRRQKVSIRARTHQSKNTPEDAVEVKAVFFEHLPRKTVTITGTKTACVKCSGKDKELATVMLLGDWHGNKHAPFVIFKTGASKHKHIQVENDSIRHGFSVRMWKEVFVLQFLHGCRIDDNPTAWWN